MGGDNQTTDNLIILLGFPLLSDVRIPFFLLIFFLYCWTLILNGTVATLVHSCHTLHHPMFFFLSHLSLCDIVLTNSIVPVMLSGVLKGTVKISVPACFTQFQIYGTALCSECLLLVVMSFDRYLAICHPLRYTTIMNTQFCLHLVIICWILGFTFLFCLVILLSRLELCSSIIDHFYCDFLLILQLSCSDISAVKTEQLLFSSTVFMVTLISIIVTYLYILKAIFRIPSILGRQKAFSTCSSHITVVGIFLGSLFGIYIPPPTGKTLNVNKVVSLLYTIATPLFNPIIYCMRNKEIKEAFKKSKWTRIMNKRSICRTLF